MISENAIRICQTVVREKIKDISIPLKLLYDDLVKAKEIVPLTELPLEKKQKYWDETAGTKFQRIVTCQALYVYDLITNQ